MAQKQRQVRMEQQNALAAMEQLEDRSDQELEMETRHRVAAQTILGARAAERYDGQRARRHFQKAIAAARPQDRMQLRRMAEASIALADRNPDTLKSSMAKLGQEAPSRRQLFMLRLAGLLVPPKGASTARRLRGVGLMLLILALLLAISFGVAMLILLPFGGSVSAGIGVGIIILIFALVTLGVVGRRRQKKARAENSAARRTSR